MSKPTRDDIITGNELVLALIADYKRLVDWDNCTFLAPATKTRIDRIERQLVRHTDNLLTPKPRKPRAAPTVALTELDLGTVNSTTIQIAGKTAAAIEKRGRAK